MGRDGEALWSHERGRGGSDGEAASSREHRPRRRGAVESDAGPPWLLLERRAASAEKLATPRWPSFMASPTLHHPVSESKSDLDLVSTSRAGVITQIVEAAVAIIVEAAVARIAKAERASERR